MNKVWKWTLVFRFLRHCPEPCNQCCLECEHFPECLKMWKEGRAFCVVRNKEAYCSEAYRVATGENVRVGWLG